jgi:hypothetical protein
MGGARGGGKTDGVLGAWALKEQTYGPAFNALAVRPTAISWEDAVERSKAIFGALGGKYNEVKMRWSMPHGGRVRFSYLESVSDADKEQGKNLTDVWVEEAGLYPTTKGPKFLPAPIARLKAAMRSAAGIPIQMILTGNPGGPGQQWCSVRYHLIPFPAKPFLVNALSEAGAETVVAVIPSRLENNKILLAQDPSYERRLYEAGSMALARAWRFGDYSAVEGAFFDCWNENRHCILPMDIPAHWLRFVAMDWGYAKPHATYWMAVASDDTWVTNAARRRVLIPRGALVVYREWYGTGGARLEADRLAVGILEREAAAGEIRGVDEGRVYSVPSIAYGVLDTACWDASRGPSIAEQLATNGVVFRQSQKNRVARGAQGYSGWDQMRVRLVGEWQGDGAPPDDCPAMMVFTTDCPNAIRTIPVLQHDPDYAEDLDTDSEDHAADAIRYGCMSRPWTRQLPKIDAGRILQIAAPGAPVIQSRQPTLDDLWEAEERRGQERI